jgi:ribonuclease P protein component
LTKTFTYQKKDKLKSRKQTQYLFAKGNAFSAGPIRLLYTIEWEDGAVIPVGTFAKGVLQAGVSAPSRHFRKAVMRNKVKRLLREGYRLERPAFLRSIHIENKRLNLFFLYTEAQIISQEEIQEKIKIVLQKLADKLK